MVCACIFLFFITDFVYVTLLEPQQEYRLLIVGMNNMLTMQLSSTMRSSLIKLLVPQMHLALGSLLVSSFMLRQAHPHSHARLVVPWVSIPLVFNLHGPELSSKHDLGHAKSSPSLYPSSPCILKHISNHKVKFHLNLCLNIKTYGRTGPLGT